MAILRPPFMEVPDTKESIEQSLKDFNIKNYTINDDLSVDVNGSVFLQLSGIGKFPVRFGKVSGNFDCSYNYLESLVGGPKEVSGHFVCSDNKLTLLEGAPKVVGGKFDCNSNHLISLVGAPEKVGGDFDCSGNNLTSLQGAPKIVGADFDCSNNSKEFEDKDVMEVSKVTCHIFTGIWD